MIELKLYVVSCLHLPMTEATRKAAQRVMKALGLFYARGWLREEDREAFNALVSKAKEDE